MSEYNVDVVIVGAGPAGSNTALELSKRKVNVMVLEKRQEIGAPKRCAEGINALTLEALGLDVDRRWAAQEITGTVVYSPNMREITVRGMRGYILERKVFEKYLAANAIKAGARYMVKTAVTDVIKEDSRVCGVKADYMGEEVIVHSKIVIAADGVDSMIAKRAGLDTVNRLTDYHSGFQYEMAGVNADETKLHLFFGNEIAPKGYVWIFPKGNTLANVGIGILGTKLGGDNRTKDYLDRFIKNNPRFFGNASPVEVNSGGIPVGMAVRTFVADGFMVMGDAAQQVNPLHGGGMALGMNAGKIVAKVAADALAEGDTSKERLSEYERIWYETDGNRMRKLLKVRTFIEKLEDKDMEKFVDILSGDDILNLTTGDTKKLVKILATKLPRLLPIAKKFLD